MIGFWFDGSAFPKNVVSVERESWQMLVNEVCRLHGPRHCGGHHACVIKVKVTQALSSQVCLLSAWFMKEI